MIVVAGKSPLLVATLKKRENVYLQVLSTGTVRVAASRQTLENTSRGLNGGLSITSSDGIRRFPWQGEFWAVGNGAPVVLDIEVA